MPISQTTNFLGAQFLVVFSKASILIILGFYIIFSLVIVRQVDLMNKTLLTKVAPIIKAVAILNAGFSIGFLLLAFGLL